MWSRSLRFVGAMWLFILALGGMYTVVQFGYSLSQLWRPRLSYETSSSTIPIVWSLKTNETAAVPFGFTIRNDGFQDSSDVYIILKLDRGNLSDRYVFEFYSPFSREVKSYDSYDTSGPIGSTFSALPPDAFVVKFPSVPYLSQITLAFNVTVFTIAIPILITVTAQVTAQSDYPVIESTPAYRTESDQIKTLFFAYLAIIVVAILGVIIATRKHYLQRFLGNNREVSET